MLTLEKRRLQSWLVFLIWFSAFITFLVLTKHYLTFSWTIAASVKTLFQNPLFLISIISSLTVVVTIYIFWVFWSIFFFFEETFRFVESFNYQLFPEWPCIMYTPQSNRSGWIVILAKKEQRRVNHVTLELLIVWKCLTQ